MDFIDYYNILELDKSATESQIKKAYRKLARKYHPDLHPNDPEAKKKFQAVNEANEVLSNPENREKYDKYGENWKHAEDIERSKQQYQSGPSSYQGARQQNFSEGDFSEFFESIFGKAGTGFTREQSVFRGRDIQATLHLRLSEVQKTHKQTFEINNKKIRIAVPAGIQDRQVIKLKGHGESGSNGGPPGDLYITFRLENDLGFKRSKDNLYTSIDIDLLTAVLGGDITIDSLDGKVKLHVKPGTQNGTKVRLRGKGFPKYKQEDQRGDLIVDYNVVIPTSLTVREEGLYRELSKEREDAAA